MAVPPRDSTPGRSLRVVPPVPAARPSPPRAPARLPRAPSVRAPATLSLVAWPALVTLAVTLLRLVGELRGWSPDYWSRLPGGGLAIVGITWLVPLVGAWLGCRLARAGVASPGLGNLLGWPAGALLVGLAFGYGFEHMMKPSWTGTLTLWALVALIVGGVSYATWPELSRPLLAYALLARLPVAILMWFAIRGRWGTHYDAPPPGFPALLPMPRWLWTGLLPQATIWIAFTLAVGMAAAAFGVWLCTAQGARGARR